MNQGRPAGPTHRKGRTKEEIPMTTTTTALTAARAEALFTSHLSTGSHPAHDVVEQAIRTAVRTHGGVRGCAADVATEYGDHPDVAVPRMRWARGVIDDLYARSRPTHPRDGWALVA
jgi:hypothetical protein